LTIGTQKRRFLFIDDLVKGYLKSLQAAWHSKEPLLRFDIASQSEYPVREICEKVHEMTNSRAVLNFGAIPIRDQEMNEKDMNLSAILALGWREQISLEEGIALIVEHERELIH
jgi:nucleoside-diphosphate-sugar epimerase